MNLIELLKNEVSENVVSSLSQKAGVSQEQVKTGFSAGIPAVLAGILKNGSGADSGFLSNVVSNITGTGNRVDDLLDGDDDSLLEKGRSLIGGLFGNHNDAVINEISSSTGLSTAKSSGLLAMIIPVITGLISKIMTNKGWDFSDLLHKIFESKDDINAALPANLSSSLNVAGLNAPNYNIPETDLPRAEAPRVAPVNYDSIQETRSGGGFLKWLIPLIVVIIALWWLFGKSGCNESTMNSTSDSLSANIDSIGSDIKSAADSVAEAVNGKLNDAGDFVRDLGATASRKLPDGKEINIAENSVENRLINFIEDKDKAVDKTTWFTFDRLFFDTGKSTLKAESQEQLNNIAAILSAYPNVNLKLGGYTDNTGDAEVNKKISTDRAEVAMQELVKLGVDSKRLEAEGYGSEHPVATNDTPEGKAQNRRIDVRVTQK